MTQDPVQKIKDEEAGATNKLSSLSKENQQKIEDYRINKEKDLEKKKEDLRSKGQASLKQAKQDAMQKFKEISETEDRERKSLINQAESKKDESIELIVSLFEKHLVDTK